MFRKRRFIDRSIKQRKKKESKKPRATTIERFILNDIPNFMCELFLHPYKDKKRDKINTLTKLRIPLRIVHGKLNDYYNHSNEIKEKLKSIMNKHPEMLNSSVLNAKIMLSAKEDMDDKYTSLYYMLFMNTATSEDKVSDGVVSFNISDNDPFLIFMNITIVLPQENRRSKFIKLIKIFKDYKTIRQELENEIFNIVKELYDDALIKSSS